MYKVLIVDDEKLIRESLELTIDWASLDLEICGKAKDGYDALLKIQEEKPDIIITDIRMPKLGGLELIKKIGQDGLNIKVIIISGYDDFKYAQQAIDLGAVGYILKPIENTEVVKIVMKALDIIKSESINEDKIKKLEEQVLKSMPLIKQKLLADLVSGELFDEKEIHRQLDFIGIHIINGLRVVLVVEIDNYVEIIKNLTEMQKQTLRISIENKIRDRLNSEGQVVFQNKNKQYTVIYSVGEEMSVKQIEKNLLFLATNISRDVRSEVGISVSIGISKLKKELLQIGAAFDEAQKAVGEKFFNMNNSIIFFDDVEQIKDFQISRLVNVEKELLSYIEMGDRDKVEEKLEEYFEVLRDKTKGSKTMFKMFLNILILRMQQFIQEFLDSEVLFESAKRLYTDIECSESFDDMRGKIRNLIFNTLNFLNQKWNNKYEVIVEKAKTYINTNYHKEDLDLEELADYLGISAGYFSLLFKQYSDVSFIKYITLKRVNESKELLRNKGLKISDIATKVGYRDVKYFNKIFKKFGGVTPSEYRNGI